MGREVRRVPPDWQHPRNESGHFRPLCDSSFEEAMEEWSLKRDEWNAPGNKMRAAYEAKIGREVTYEEWIGPPPVPAYYRPAWTDGSATAWQVYENVSEGTPVSPVFPTREALVDWLVNVGSGMGIGGVPQKLSRAAADRFVDAGYAPSAIGIEGVGLFAGVLSHERKP